jgi:hypothetical protein
MYTLREGFGRMVGNRHSQFSPSRIVINLSKIMENMDIFWKIARIEAIALEGNLGFRDTGYRTL